MMTLDLGTGSCLPSIVEGTFSRNPSSWRDKTSGLLSYQLPAWVASRDPCCGMMRCVAYFSLFPCEYARVYVRLPAKGCSRGVGLAGGPARGGEEEGEPELQGRRGKGTQDEGASVSCLVPRDHLSEPGEVRGSVGPPLAMTSSCTQVPVGH